MPECLDSEVLHKVPYTNTLRPTFNYRLTVLREESTLNQKRSGIRIRINLDSHSDVCRITAKMLWIHYLVGVSNFTECRENRSVTYCMRNANKSIPQW